MATTPTLTLTTAVDAVLAVSVDALDEAEVQAELAVLEVAARRLRARQGELVGALADRQARRAREAAPRDVRAGERARRQTAQDLAARLSWTPGQAKRTIDTQRQLRSLPGAVAASREGRLPFDHARVLTDTLVHLVGDDRAALEAELVEAAGTMDAVRFGRLCRRRLAEVDPEAAERDADRRHQRRSARLVQHPDGITTLRAALSGLDAEIVWAGIDGFRTPDTPEGGPRTPEQRTADALVAMAQAALDAGPGSRRSRPHVQVRIDWADLVGGKPGQATWTGPITATDIRRLLDDADISRLVTGPDSLPLDVGRTRRSAPAAVWRAIVARDRCCTWPGCDAPPEWCQAAHLDRRWANGAGTSVAEQALACTAHHRMIDRRRLVGRLEDGRVVWHPPDG